MPRGNILIPLVKKAAVVGLGVPERPALSRYFYNVRIAIEDSYGFSAVDRLSGHCCIDGHEVFYREGTFILFEIMKCGVDTTFNDANPTITKQRWHMADRVRFELTVPR